MLCNAFAGCFSHSSWGKLQKWQPYLLSCTIAVRHCGFAWMIFTVWRINDVCEKQVVIHFLLCLLAECQEHSLFFIDQGLEPDESRIQNECDVCCWKNVTDNDFIPLHKKHISHCLSHFDNILIILWQFCLCVQQSSMMPEIVIC